MRNDYPHLRPGELYDCSVFLNHVDPALDDDGRCVLEFAHLRFPVDPAHPNKISARAAQVDRAHATRQSNVQAFEKRKQYTSQALIGQCCGESLPHDASAVPTDFLSKQPKSLVYLQEVVHILRNERTRFNPTTKLMAPKNSLFSSIFAILSYPELPHVNPQ